LSQPEQPPPTPGEGPASWDGVIDKMRGRDRLGESRYGTRLRPHNGRDALRDLQEELLDGAVYAENALRERDELLRQLADLKAALRTVLDNRTSQYAAEMARKVLADVEAR
jgi:hypothetical protein